MEPRQYYSYALKNYELINVENATKGEVYLCPHCGAVMIPKQGTKRRWHFAHKGDTGSCSYESYLHKLAKRRIRECFLSAEHFEILLPSNAICSYPVCPVGKSEKCRFPRHIDLKEYYDCCEEEVTVDEYRADLKLTHSSKIERVPVLIEIRVSHECTEEKKKSGHKIIEVGIDSEEDIDRIVRTATIDGRENWSLRSGKLVERNRFYGFKEMAELPAKEHQCAKFRFWIDARGFHFDKLDDYDGSVKCLTPNPPEIESAQFLIESSRPIDWDLAFYKLSTSGLGIRYCAMCSRHRFNEYYDKSICILYKTFGTRKFPKQLDAVNCPHFEQVDYRSGGRVFAIDFEQECKVTIKR